MPQEHITLPVGVTVRDPDGDHYVIEGLLGKGGFDAVYLVRERQLKQRLFALKEVIDPIQQDRDRFIFEGEILKRLNHRALPRVYRVFEHEKLKRVYMLMDYIEGRDLEVLRQEQPEQRFSLALVFNLLTPIVDALSYLHIQDPPIIHRDIKPANIVVPTGANEAILVNFGIAKQYVADAITATIRRGTPGYAAPEQYQSGTNPRTDIYGLGATLYTLLTGTVPADAFSRVMRGKGPDPLKPAHLLVPAAPTAVAEAIQRAMSIGSADRFATVGEFWQVLTDHAIQLPVEIYRVPPADVAQSVPESSAKHSANAPLQRSQHAPRSRKHLLPRSMWNRFLVFCRKFFRFSLW